MKKDTIVAFHVGRGGRFYNAGFLTFLGENSIGRYTEKLFSRFENQDKFKDRLGFDYGYDDNKCILDCIADEDFETLELLYGITEEMLGELQYYTDGGHFVGLTEKEVEEGVGCIDIDRGYDTTYTKYLKDCDRRELLAIYNSNEWNKIELLEEFGIENAEELEKEGELESYISYQYL